MKKENNTEKIRKSIEDLKRNYQFRRWEALHTMNQYQAMRERMKRQRPEDFTLQFSDVLNTIEYWEHRAIMFEQFTQELTKIESDFI